MTTVYETTLRASKYRDKSGRLNPAGIRFRAAHGHDPDATIEGECAACEDARIASRAESLLDLDLIFTDLGTVWTVKAVSDAGREFLDTRVGEVESWMGTQHHFTSDWRPMRDLANFAQSEGLLIGGRQ